MSERPKAIVVGAGFGGLSCAIRLQAMGFDVEVVEKLDKPGGRAYTKVVDGHVFDMGPTVITVPHFIEEIFALKPGDGPDAVPDFPAETLDPDVRIREGISGGPATSRYVELSPVLPFYRIYFDDGSHFDYDGDPESTVRQIRAIEPDDVEGYHRFHAAAKAIFDRGFLELGYATFTTMGSMFAVAPDLLRLDAVRNLFRFTSRYFKSEKLRQVFSFETLLVGGNPLNVPAIYAMIHFVEKHWGIHYAKGGTGALVAAYVAKLEELGGKLRCDAPVSQILVEGGRATGVKLEDGTQLDADVVVSNADYANTYMKLIEPQHRRRHSDAKIKRKKYSMSLVVIYFGFEKREGDAELLHHHNVILGPRYEALLTEIFDGLSLAEDFSQYLHVPTFTDPSMGPENAHTAYTLIPVPHNGSGLNWSELGEPFVRKILEYLDERGYIPDLEQRLTHLSWVTPDYFEDTLDSYLGSAFSVEPRLLQTAYFRPHNRSEDVPGLYLVGAGTQPGAGLPSVMMSAKMTAREIASDYAARLAQARAS